MNRKYTEDEVIAALIASETVSEAASRLGCTTRTIYNYAASDGFSERLAQWRSLREEANAKAADNAVAAAYRRLCEILEADTSGICSDVTVREQLDAARILLTSTRTRSSIVE